jgi:limonene 1,2-monooxygenase
MTQRMRFGIFLAPFHPLDEDPTQALERDLELVQHLDELGYEEAWIGEHHSGGYEIIASPELFMAAAAERTKRIRLGSGVVSLPYHHPLMVANRFIQLDHMTRGRVMLGVGPGLLPSDAFMLGIEVSRQREMMLESLEVILRLMDGEVVTHKSDWFELNNARCHLLPYTKPRPEVCVASTITPSGGRAAGRLDLGMLCVAATQEDGFDVLGQNWGIANEMAMETRGVPMDHSVLRLVGPMHLAETREQARKNVEYGLQKFLDYFTAINPTAAGDDMRSDDPVESMIESGRAVIGTPADAVEQIERLQKQTGGFGCFLQLAHNWANWENTKKSYELFARHVVPHFTHTWQNRADSLQWAMDNSKEFIGAAMNAAMQTIQKHHQERAAKKAAEGE